MLWPTTTPRQTQRLLISPTSGRQVRELQAVLGTPYAEQDAATEARWAQVTPKWARQKAGLAFMT